MRKEDEVRLRHMLDAANEALAFARDTARNDLDADRKLVLRIDRMPDVEVHIVPSTEAPTGVGEPATPVIAPAVANVLYAATGKRYYRLPIKL